MELRQLLKDRRFERLVVDVFVTLDVCTEIPIRVIVGFYQFTGDTERIFDRRNGRFFILVVGVTVENRLT
tara:strand:- start:3031 stop:3240 length:210 start_codon:yes stop_codon:yes gene_type:complete